MGKKPRSEGEVEHWEVPGKLRRRMVERARHLMLLPSLDCPARCAYCFGPNRGPVMAPEVLDTAAEWIAATTPADQPIDLTFHGGEPLVAGLAWYRRALPLLRARFGPRLELGMQSNLWLLDDELAALLREYDVSLGTSLDGPEEINDAQRGTGYFSRTMAGVATARRHGLSVGVICTFTQRSAPRYREVFDFFAGEGLTFSVHEAVCTLDSERGDGLSLSPEEHADLFTALFEYYLDHITCTRISTFDAMARGIAVGQGGICTFRHCLGHYLAIGPEGGIYSCNRFAHHSEWRLGYVQELPTLESLSTSSAWERQRGRELRVQEECGDCPHWAYCQGGCAYNAFTAGRDHRDPHCPAYRRVFSYIADRALEQVFSPENLEAVVQGGADKHGLLRKGALLQIMRGGPHPQDVARRARETVAAVALAVSASPEEAVEKLNHAGLVTRPELARQSLESLRTRLATQSQQGLVNAYLHVTYACNLACDHCYARAGPGAGPAMAVEDTARLVREAAAAGFRKAVITGGEPLLHPQRDALLDALAGLREKVRPLEIVLRTNLALPLDPALVERLARCAGQVVVSVDGDETAHDARRGAGSYARTVGNLRSLAAAAPGQVVLAATLSTAQTGGPVGDAVRALGKELGVGVRFKPVLPLGRAQKGALAHEFYSSLDEGSAEAVVSAHPAATCGLGMNVYLAPDGVAFPCYTLTAPKHMLGNALVEGLPAVLARNNIYRQVTVDSNEKCRGCALRYLCGGFCRAWGSGDDPDAPPADCAALYARAEALLAGALEALKADMERWGKSGLPLPSSLAGR